VDVDIAGQNGPGRIPGLIDRRRRGRIDGGPALAGKRLNAEGVSEMTAVDISELKSRLDENRGKLDQMRGYL